MRNKHNKSSGFTIIEVLIVLAIAGLIMLIVFLAVPALQRNAHNTQIKDDVAGVLGAINEYSNNNNGVLPTAASYANNTITVGSGCGSGTNCTTSKVGYVTAIDNPTATIVTTPPPLGTVRIYTKAVCGGTS